jgi:glycine cleavage system H protein
MGSPSDRRYNPTHEWHLLDAGLVTIGLSRFAVDELTDITYVDLAKARGPVKAGQSLGEIESVKATSEIYCGVDGTIVEVNARAVEDPGLLNRDPYGEGWLVRVRPDDPAQIQALLSAAQYDQSTGQDAES